MNITLKIASTPSEFETAKLLFEEYAAALNVDLCFQGFDEELKTLNTQYNLPKGCLFIAYDNQDPIGCVAIREFEGACAELKRMYIKAEYRGKKLGQKLLESSFEKAIELGYTKMRLDTLPQMNEAQTLYKKYGFKEIESYRFNPVKGTVYMEKHLV